MNLARLLSVRFFRAPLLLLFLAGAACDEGTAPVTPMPIVAEVEAETFRNQSLEVRVPMEAVDPDRVQISIETEPESGELEGPVEVGADSAVFRYVPDPGFVGQDGFEVEARDEETILTATFVVQVVNRAPVAASVTDTVAPGASVDILLPATDADGDSVIVAIEEPPTAGTLGEIRNAEGEAWVTYTAPESTPATGEDRFSYVADDGVDRSAPAEVSLVINAAPTASAVRATTGEGEPVEVSLSATDPEEGALTFRIVEGPTRGTLGPVTQGGGDAATIVYTPGGSGPGNDAFTYEAVDALGAASAPARVDIEIRPANGAPAAAALSVAVLEDVPLAIELVGTDPDGDRLTFQLLDAPEHGSIDGLPGTGDGRLSVTYMSESDWSGTDRFTYRVVDAGGIASPAATVAIRVEPANDAPVPGSVTATGEEGEALSVVLRADDVEGGALEFALEKGPEKGSLSGLPATSENSVNLIYTPTDSEWSGTDAFTYRVTDQQGASATATATVTLQAGGPTASDVTVSGAAGVAISVTLTGSDADSDQLEFTLESGPANGSVSGLPATGASQVTVTYTSTSSFRGTDTFTFKVTDPGGLSATGTASVTVVAPSPSISSFAASATQLVEAQPTILSWNASNATSCSIDNGVGSVSCSGNTTLTPGSSKTYTLTATGDGGTATSTTSVTVGQAGRWVYATDDGGSEVYMYSIAAGTGALTAIGGGTIAPQGTTPRGVVADPAGRYLFVTNRDSDNVAAFTIDSSTGQLTANGTTATGDQPGGVVVDPTGRWVFVASAGAGTVRSYTIGTSGQLTANGSALAAGTDPTGIAVDPLGKYLYVTALNSARVYAFTIGTDGTLSANGSVAVATGPYTIAADPTGKWLYVTSVTGKTITRLDIASDGTVTSGATVAMPAEAYGSAVDPTGDYAYFGIGGITDDIYQYTITAGTGALVANTPASINGGNNHPSIAVEPAGDYLYAPAIGGALHMFSINNDGTLSAIGGGTIGAGTSPRGVAVSR